MTKQKGVVRNPESQNRTIYFEVDSLGQNQWFVRTDTIDLGPFKSRKQARIEWAKVRPQRQQAAA